MSCQTMVASPHVEHHHQHDNRTGPSSISSLLNRTRTGESQDVPKEDTPSSPQPPPTRRESDQLAVAVSSSDTACISPMSAYHHLPTPKSPAVPMLQHGYSENKKYLEKDHHRPRPSPAKTTVVHHYEMIPRSAEDTSSGRYASFSLKDTSSPARQHHHSISKVTSGSTPRPFACTECDQTFSRAHNLKSHFATHSTDRPFKCDSCSAKFRRLHDLKRHQKLHTGERPYVCSTCQRCFSRLDALNRHQRTEGSSACHYRRRNTTPTINIEETMTAITAPASTPKTPPLPQQQQQQRPNIPQLDLRYLNTNDRIALPSPHTRHQTSPSPSPSPSQSQSLPEQPYHHRPPYHFSDPSENFASLQAAYAKLYDQYHSAHEGIHIRTQANEDEVKSLRQSLYDLQVENRVLRSLVVERQPNKDAPMKRK